MAQLAPTGPVYQAGALSGNPLAMAAGIATLTLIASDPALYERLQQTSRALVTSFVDAAERAGIPLAGAALGALAGFFFASEEVTDYEAARRSDAAAYARFFRAMLERGVYLPPSRFEALFVSAAHRDEDVERVGSAALEALTAGDDGSSLR